MYYGKGHYLVYILWLAYLVCIRSGINNKSVFQASERYALFMYVIYLQQLAAYNDALDNDHKSCTWMEINNFYHL